MSARALVAAGCLFLVAGASAVTEPAVEGTFVETIDVHVVDVEAVVTDRAGRRVEGLGPDDFRLLVDGEELPIGYFTEIRDHQVIASSPGDASGPARVPAVEPDRPAPVRYLVFFDEVFTSGRDRELMAGEIEQHVDRLGPEDTMTLVAFDGRSPIVLVDDSNDPGALRSGLTAMAGERFFSGQARRAERSFFRDAMAEFDASRRTVDGLRASSSFRASLLVDRDMEDVLEALAVSMRRLSRVAAPGRRVLLWVTGGWPIQPSFDAMQVRGPDRPGEEPEAEFGRKRRLERFARLASRLGFTLYPVDAPGWQMSGSGGSDGLSAAGEGVGSSPYIVGFGEQELHATLEVAAEITGGRAYLNSFRRDALERVIDDVGTYYWLGFDAPWPNDGREHRIELRSRRDDLEVRARTGVWAPPSERLNALDVLAADFQTADDRFDGLWVRLGEAAPIDDELYRLPVELVFEVETLGALPVEAGHQVQVEARVVAVDHRGRFSEPVVHPIRLTSAQPPTAGGTARFDFEAILPAKAERLLVTLHDRLGESVFLAAAPLGGPPER